MNQTYTIYLKNCAFFAYHGVYKEEKAQGQRFFVDIEIEIPQNTALENDLLEKTVDYSTVFFIAEKIIMNTKRNLIEALAADIAKALHEQFGEIVRIVVAVRKPSALIQGILDYVETRVEYKY
ncbi:dihydroneopterin aldolase [Candidatus Liberibacter solanacearum CLso-ZC1]|uniref:7,8-dihydroneopterin aldolase n=1 Tax=Liberibacter solanacearum (strain CLso-ZC1) TaxID=658172 RepID=E4UBC0_LIBSC|nr:dihydroneopterin aldolase [Candidatus Liberibacter solanacearum]ADR52599.1 dihydroneopterin aldolase [Candidatus Liberibacter solanacearum CLso-ZC1]